MAKNKMTDLRDHLFEQIERLKDEEVNLEKEIDRTKAIIDVSNIILKSAEIENNYIDLVGGLHTLIQSTDKIHIKDQNKYLEE